MKKIMPVLIIGLVMFCISRKEISIVTTEFVIVDASREQIWNLSSACEGAFEESNPAHQGTEILTNSETPFRDSLRFYQKEMVGGITGELDGLIYDVHPKKRFRWKANTTYNFWGLEIKVDEGGFFRIEQTKQATRYRVTHRGYGNFSDTFKGRLVGGLMVSFFAMQQSAADHTMTELQYFKKLLQK